MYVANLTFGKGCDIPIVNIISINCVYDLPEPIRRKLANYSLRNFEKEKQNHK